MAATQISARDWTFEIQDPNATTPTWTEIKGVTSFSVDRSMQEVDMTTFDDDGIYAGQAMERGKTLTLDGRYLEDASGARDAGQTLVEEAADAVGDTSLYDFRFTSPNGVVRTWSAYVNETVPGGGNNDKTGFGATITKSGSEAVS